MADLHKLTVQESLNSMGPGGVWTVNAVGTAGSSASAANTIHLDVSGASIIGIHPAVDIYFNFSATTTDVTAANDLPLSADTLIFITVPRGLGKTIYFNYISQSTTTGAVKTVEV